MALQESTSAAMKGNLRKVGVSDNLMDNLLLGLVVVVRILRVFDGVLNQLLERVLLANELDELRVATAAAEHHKPVLFVQELLDGAAILLVQKLVDLDVSSAQNVFVRN